MSLKMRLESACVYGHLGVMKWRLLPRPHGRISRILRLRRWERWFIVLQPRWLLHEAGRIVCASEVARTNRARYFFSLGLSLPNTTLCPNEDAAYEIATSRWVGTRNG
jgi:hypothetical protein